MENMKENMTFYIILTITGILIAFGVDHYLLGDQMSVLMGLLIVLAPVILLMFRDLVREA